MVDLVEKVYLYLIVGTLVQTLILQYLVNMFL